MNILSFYGAQKGSIALAGILLSALCFSGPSIFARSGEVAGMRRTAGTDSAQKDEVTFAGKTEETFAQIIKIDGNDEGRVFEGVGAVSAGGSSRLLIDYPEPYRSDILDYLFRPNFGASLQHLKVEIGGDMNSTAGTEPSHARTRRELEQPQREYYQRGYEYWLMREARERNPEIIFDCLQWGAPGWFRGGFYSQDNADYIVAFIKGAKKYHGVDIRFAGTWNEKPSPHTRDWIVNVLRPTLDRNGLDHVGIIADDWHTPQWQFAAEVLQDSSLRKAVHALGYHYVRSTSTDTARLTGLPLWESEAWSKSGEWPNALLLARQLNKNYIRGRITKTEIWNPVDAYYENLAWSGMGVMTASTPWSGHYEVEPAIWALAHTTQFAKPGWMYVNSGCDTTASGTYFVTLKEPGVGKENYSLIITGGRRTETLRFRISNLSGNALQVWTSDSSRQFVRQETIRPENGLFSLEVAPNAIYSLTTTTGQQKGLAANPVPKAAGFPRDYSEDFEEYETGSTPAYLSDQGGAFEVFHAKGESKTLRQVITEKLIPWDSWGPNNPEPFTEFGEFFSDCEVSVRALVEDSGTVKLFGRVKYFESNKSAHGYALTADHQGNWKLLRFQTPLDSGKVAFSAGTWHTLKLQFKGDNIRAFIDEKPVSALEDTTYSSGYAGIGTGWNHARFDNIQLAARTTYPDSIADSGTYLNSIKAELKKEWPHNRTVNLVFHGHSVPSGYFRTPEVRTLESYPYLVLKELKSLYPNAVINVILTSIGGENSVQGAKRFREDVLPHRPDVLFIDYALNDRGAGLEKARAAWEEMIVEALKNDIKVILLTPSPDQRVDIGQASNELESFTRMIKGLAEKHHTGLADSYEQFRQLVLEGKDLREFMAQVNHPNRKGHELIAAEIMEYFK